MLSRSFLCREKGPEDKGKQKKKIKEKKATKSKYKEGEDDLGGWTEVKGSSLSSAVCSFTPTNDVDRFNQAAKL